MSQSEARTNYKRMGNDTQSQNVEDLKTHAVEGESKAPTGLLAEFLCSVMMKDYQTAFKYCSEILNFEPNNTTARDFYPLILEKLEMKENESSSDSSSTDSKSSVNSLVSCQSSDDDARSSSDSESYPKLKRNSKINLADANSNTGEKRPGEKNIDAMRSIGYLTPSKESSARAVPTEENFVKTLSKKELQIKATDRASALSSKILIHPTKTKILKSSTVLREEKKKQFKSKKPKQKDQETPVVSQNQSSPKILLYPTRTITFPKVPSSND